MRLNEASDPTGYVYASEQASHTQAYLWEPVKTILREQRISKVFDLGCGNGAFAFNLASLGLEVTGVDPSSEGIQVANARIEAELGKKPALYQGNAYDSLSERFGTYPCIVSLEVVEHVYFPRKFAECVHNLLEPGGIAVVSTPYHSYLKNLALAATG